MDKIHILKQITERFLYMFAGANIGLTVPDGWSQTFEALYQHIDAELGENTRGLHLSQCKEKLVWPAGIGTWVLAGAA